MYLFSIRSIKHLLRSFTFILLFCANSSIYSYKDMVTDIYVCEQYSTIENFNNITVNIQINKIDCKN
jgi:hypothetical protein